MSVTQIRAVWTGGPSSPGLTIFNVQGSTTGDFDAAVAAVASFFDAFKGGLPDEYRIQVEQTAYTYSEVDGGLQGLQTASAQPAATVGLSANAYASGVGFRMDWNTSAIARRRRVRGRTYIVPFGGNNFGPDGNIVPALESQVELVGAQLIGALETSGFPLVVWSRPSLKYPVGEINPVISVSAVKKPAVLRGRRD